MQSNILIIYKDDFYFIYRNKKSIININTITRLNINTSFLH